ncbi:DUF4179 domain-containing protein [Natronorubrum sp. JWXQ-INN-674]|uniref:DUF4179 domain-containing protein n=1 Tax=Natronorubrum halalkaliphilum TaxID=2691917 RepID=A0A6B0VIZ5_9EURY|nr:CARDB domain-containing protein [Natronorubrum halalkaliphilum]MXV61528.1 DUF4179 domain-containing protein [Natronorubrum halalkaliphilum]
MSSRETLGTIKRIGAILIAIVVVLAAGIVVGQAPAIFGVETDSEASIVFEDQQSDGETVIIDGENVTVDETAVVIDEVSLSDGGFVVVTGGGDDPLAVSDYLGSGTHENVTVEREEDADGELVGQLTATVHQDTTGDETYAYGETDGAEDRPYLENGFPVSDTATVTSEDDGVLGDSFAVDSFSTPSSATTNETIEIVAEISNPTDLGTQQNVDLRLDGALLEQRAVTLESEESREVTFEIDTVGTPPGERTIGVYTDADGAVESIDLEFHTEPAVEVVAATDENVTLDVAIPVDGFVAIEDENGTIVGASDALEPGEHANVTAEFDENATVEDDDELTAILYEGDPDEPDEASPFEPQDDDEIELDADSESVETTFTIADVREEADDDADDDGDTDDGDDADDEET